jgi:prepilin-type N-terminal cleavage/methylation domain-containing protein
MKITNLKSTAGFTIVELMIALSVLSVLLVAASVVMIQVGSLYTKGVNAANLQTVNRNIVSDLSTTIQFSGASPASCVVAEGSPGPCTEYSDGGNYKVTVFCIDNIRYSYVLDREMGNDPYPAPGLQTNHVLWRDTLANGEACSPLDLSVAGKPTGSSADGYDMVPAHMRLINFSVTEGTDGLYTIDVAMAYGDSDLVNASNNTCNTGPGTQYCSNSDITTTVGRRVQ